jgi:hypothetical protein
MNATKNLTLRFFSIDRMSQCEETNIRRRNAKVKRMEAVFYASFRKGIQTENSHEFICLDAADVVSVVPR